MGCVVLKVKEESNFYFFNLRMTRQAKRTKSELRELKYDFNLQKKISFTIKEIDKNPLQKLPFQIEMLEYRNHNPYFGDDFNDIKNIKEELEKKKKKLDKLISVPGQYKNKLDKNEKELKKMRKQMKKQENMHYQQIVSEPSGIYCIVGSSMLENFHLENLQDPENFKEANRIKKFVNKPNVFKIGKTHLKNIPLGKLNILSKKGYIGTNPDFGRKFSKEHEPILIGKKKTGRGNYYYTNGTLFLAMDKSSLSLYLNPLEGENEGVKLSRERIPDETQIFVWKRDGGQCVKCGTDKNLAYDHIIPHSLGGSNSRRNLQLLCDSCNSRKGNRIGG